MESVYIHTRIRTRTKARSNKENNISQARFTPFAPKGCIVVPPLKKRERESKHEKARKTRVCTVGHNAFQTDATTV